MILKGDKVSQVRPQVKDSCPFSDEIVAFRRGLIFTLIIAIILSVHLMFVSMGYKIEMELGNSLSPIIGKYAILIVQDNPPEVYIGDIVTVVCGGDMGVITMRKVVKEVAYYIVDVNHRLGVEYIRLVSPTRDYGWFPVSSVRSKVVKILFRGIVKPPTQPIIFPPEEILGSGVK